jgi:hypothetical protein
MMTMHLDHAAACIDWLGLKSVAVSGEDAKTVASVVAWLSSRNGGLGVSELYPALRVDLVVNCPEALEEGEEVSQLSVCTSFPV